MKNNLIKKQKGFMLVEVVIASAIIVIITFAIVSAAQKGIALSQRALHESQASYLLEEGAEVVKIVRDNNWTTFAALTLGINYYYTYDNASNTWSLTTVAPVPSTIDSLFTRTVVFSSVNRDSATEDIVTSGGVIDTRTKKVVVTVSWPYNGSTISKTLSYYVSDIFN